MENIIDVAGYIFEKYKSISDEIVDEMKLHKLLYFSLREYYAIMNEPLFESDFEGWEYGPVSPSVRYAYTDSGIRFYRDSLSDQAKYVINNVICEYGSYASWKLSKLSHEDISWKNSRKGLEPHDIGNEKLLVSDIIEDARRIRPYDHVWDMYYDEFDDCEEVGV